MVTKTITFDHAAREALEKGVDWVAETVKRTLGPAGRNVVIERRGQTPMVINDGVTIAKEIELKDKAQNCGAMLVRDVCAKTNELAGDGTTTAAILVQAIIQEGLKNVAAGANPMLLRRGINKASAAATEELKKISHPVDGSETIKRIATISSGNEDIFGEVIAAAMEKVGNDGIISVEESKTLDTTIEYVEGMQFDKGYISAYFVNNMERMEVVLNEPYILCVDHQIATIAEIGPILDLVARKKRSLLLIAEDVQGEALAMLVINSLKQTVPACAIKAPGFADRKDILADIATLTGATLVTPDTGERIAAIDLSYLGIAFKVVCTKDKTILVTDQSHKKDVEARVASLRVLAEKADNIYEKQAYESRIGKLLGGAVILRIGGVSETELKDRKLRLEDALNATRAAIAEGYVPGGGVSLLTVSNTLNCSLSVLRGDELTGFNIVLKALEAPCRQIADNAGHHGITVVDKILENPLKLPSCGFDAAIGEYCDMISAGIIDPAKVERVAVQQACSIAGMFLTTEALIVSDPEDPKPMMPQYGSPMMG